MAATSMTQPGGPHATRGHWVGDPRAIRNLQQTLCMPTRLTEDDAASTQLFILASECSHSNIQENQELTGTASDLSVTDVCDVTLLEGHTITRKP